MNQPNWLLLGQSFAGGMSGMVSGGVFAGVIGQQTP
jgi:hypothetical protein